MIIEKGARPPPGPPPVLSRPTHAARGRVGRAPGWMGRNRPENRAPARKSGRQIDRVDPRLARTKVRGRRCFGSDSRCKSRPRGCRACQADPGHRGGRRARYGDHRPRRARHTPRFPSGTAHGPMVTQQTVCPMQTRVFAPNFPPLCSRPLPSRLQPGSRG